MIGPGPRGMGTMGPIQSGLGWYLGLAASARATEAAMASYAVSALSRAAR